MEELQFVEYWKVIQKRWLLVTLIPLVTACLSASFAFFVATPKYEAITTLLVNQRSDTGQQLQYAVVEANQALVNTYSEIIKSSTLESTVIKQLNIPYSTQQLNSMISVSSPNNSAVIDVKVVDRNHIEAVSIANSLAKAFQTRAQSLMNVQNVQVIDSAAIYANPNPVEPNKTSYITIALVMGLIMSVALAFILEYADNRIRTQEDAQRYLRLPILGVVVDYDKALKF